MSSDIIARARAVVAAPLQPVGSATSSTLVARAKADIAATPDTHVFVARQPPPPPPPDKLVVATDATGSRAPGWIAARALEDRFLKSLPERYDIALAVYHSDLDTFTPFTSNRRRLRALAARIACTGWRECLPDVLARVVKIGGVSAVINFTDASAVCGPEAREYAKALRAVGTRIFILLDPSDGMSVGYTPPIFAEITTCTSGAILPFETASVRKLLRYLTPPMVGRLHHG